MTDKTEWRIVTTLWDHNGACWPQLFPRHINGPTVDVPDVDVPRVPFQTCHTLDRARACWHQATAGHWIPDWAARAHVSAALVYVNQGGGWMARGHVTGTHALWVRDVAPTDPHSEWVAKVAKYVNDYQHGDAA